MNLKKLQKLSKLIRYYILLSTARAGSGHPTTALSATDLMTVLFFKYLRFDLKNPDNPANDRVIFSKGHGSPLLYALYAAAGAIKPKDLENLRKFDSPLEGHPTPRFKYTEAATGSLGQGLSVGLGMALALRQIFNVILATHSEAWRCPESAGDSGVGRNNRPPQNDYLPHVYVLLGDGEMAEGSVWEAIVLASKYKVSNLVGVLDVNRLAQSDEALYGHNVSAYEKRIKSFGWNTIVVDGHDISAIDKAIAEVQSSKLKVQSLNKNKKPSKQVNQLTNIPTMIIAKTIKGKGVSFVEDKPGWHGKPLKGDDFVSAVKGLGKVDKKMRGKIKKPNFQFPISNFQSNSNVQNSKHSKRYTLNAIRYSLGDKIATRKAYGQALAELGQTYPNIVALDADTKNSTYSEIFKKAYPDRFFDMYIAEQNMVGAAIGMARLGFIPFASTFACFLTRAFDQIRMAAVGQANIKLVGSHAGVSIGADGASQMGLEDFAMFRAVHGSVVLHPSDAVSTKKLIHEMIDCPGIVYMRTSRPATEVIYSNKERFEIGGSKVHSLVSPLEQPRRIAEQTSEEFSLVTIVATGVCVHEALKAQNQLKSDGIAVRVIDCYSIKPIDAGTLRKAAKETKALIVVEDHWFEGGLGDAVLNVFADKPGVPIHKLAVTKMPRSGTPEELMDWVGISSKAIVKKVKKILKN